jgi:hypothetical protein
VLFIVLCARLLLLFFSAAKRKVTKESAAHGPNAPQGHGMAIRWFVVVCKALLSGMVLVFCLCGAMVKLGCKGKLVAILERYCWHRRQKRHHQAMGLQIPKISNPKVQSVVGFWVDNLYC